MSNIEDWIKDQKLKGYSDKQLEQHLVGQGYNKEEVDKILLNVDTGHGSVKPKRSIWLTILIIIGIIFLIFMVLSVVAYFTFRPIVVAMIEKYSSNVTDELLSGGNFTRINNNASISNITRVNVTSNTSIVNNSVINVTQTNNTNITNTTINTSVNTAVCGNNHLDVNESCDGRLLNDVYCWNINTSNGKKFNGGTLKCSSNCTFDTSSCTYCGDNVISTNSGEECEIIGGKVFSTVFFKGSNPHEWELSKINPCINFGYASGSVFCGDTCRINVSGCATKLNATCGNGLLEGNEECDFGVIGKFNESVCSNFIATGRSLTVLNGTNVSITGIITGGNSTHIIYTPRYNVGNLACTQECKHDYSGCGYQ
jgi:hypothetical protein